VIAGVLLGTTIAMLCMLLGAPAWVYALGCIASTGGAVVGWWKVHRGDRP
jgi:hypothetical protein